MASVAQWSECSHGLREVLGSSPGRAMCFFLPCDIGGSVWVRARAASSKGTVSSVPAWFREDSGTNLIKQGEIVIGRPCGSVVSGQSARTVCERSCVRVPVGPCAFSSPARIRIRIVTGDTFK